MQDSFIVRIGDKFKCTDLDHKDLVTYTVTNIFPNGGILAQDADSHEVRVFPGYGTFIDTEGRLKDTEMRNH